MRWLSILVVLSFSGSALAQGCFVREYTQAHLAKNPDQSVRLIRAWVETDAVVRVYVMAEFKADDARYFAKDLFCMQLPWDTNGVDVCEGTDGSIAIKDGPGKALLLYTEGLPVAKDNTSAPRNIAETGAIGTTYKMSKVIDEYCRR